MDLVTEADLRAQEHIVSLLSSRFPDHGILAEEDLDTRSGQELVWVVDPLDGTTNFAHGYPVFSVSIGLAQGGAPILGVVYDPSSDEMFVAGKNCGATLNGYPIRVSSTSDLTQSLLVTGFPYWTREHPERLFKRFSAFTMVAQGVRRAGSASLDMCALACGRLDGFWEEGLRAWDTCAGSVIVLEAGGAISKFDGSTYDMSYPETLATNKLLHQAMIEVLRAS